VALQSKVEGIKSLHREILSSWNDRDAAAYARCFTSDAIVVGFDGSEMIGRGEIERAISQIFSDHPTGAYVAKVREAKFLAPDVAVLHAVAGLVPAGRSDINPDLNAVQTLVAVKREDRWEAAVFQNTPAAYHGRPEAKERLTHELREALHSLR
jgi:uncharacterized protein (TIGR02246 family)